MAGFEDFIAALPVWLKILGGQLLLIAIPASAAFILLYRWKGNPWRRRKIQAAFESSATVRREVRYSILTALVFALNGYCIYLLMGQGWTLIYTDWAEYGWLYGAFSLVAAIVLHDAYFYWAHRLMHLPRLYQAFHRLHHDSLCPTPWAAYAFAPMEAVLQTMFLTILIFILPVHVTVIYLFMVHMIVRNVIGHSGFELFPRGTAAHAVFGLLTTNTHHDLHHSCDEKNYGLYFTWWDRLCGTEHPDYHEIFEYVASGRAADERKRAKLDAPLNA
ncbi:MAG: sterol desaturase family protein [Alphaproteobacteria bacterium]|nr:sterol desaturase family protein [Alphaproteobacteria bacterium]